MLKWKKAENCIYKNMPNNSRFFLEEDCDNPLIYFRTIVTIFCKRF